MKHQSLTTKEKIYIIYLFVIIKFVVTFKFVTKDLTLKNPSILVEVLLCLVKVIFPSAILELITSHVTSSIIT